MIEAIKGSGALITVIAKRLGVSYRTVFRYLKRWSSVREAYEEERNTVCDWSEYVLVTNIRLIHAQQERTGIPQDISDVLWYLSRKGRDRGYGNRADISNTGDNRERVEVVYVNDP